MTDIGFIGLGGMGSAMAGRLVAASYTVHVWNRSPEPVARLVQDGAVAAENAAAALGTGIVFSMLANDAAAEAVFTAEVLAGAPEGSLHVNHSTLSVAATDRLAGLHEAAGVSYVSAPVIGRPPVAEAGNLGVMAAGSAEAIRRAQPFLDVIGKHTWVVGERPSAGSLIKIGVNYNLIHTLQALAESLTLVESGGIDGELFVEILTDALYTGAAYSGYGSLIARKRYAPPGMSVAMGRKDLGLVEEAAEANGVTLPTAPVLREMFDATLADDQLAELDWAAIAEITRNLAQS